MDGSGVRPSAAGIAPGTTLVDARGQVPHVVVFGNEKGGTGKSTTALHVVVSLLHQGHRVGALDLDARQGTLTRYMRNRQDYMQRHDLELPVPVYRAIDRSTLADQTDASADETERFNQALAELSSRCDFIVIDTPGADTTLGRLGHTFADTLITPINDSFVDLDLLATLDPDSLKILRPSTYAAMVWEHRMRRQQRDRGVIDWIVMRNRLSHLDARNKREVGQVLETLSKRIGFRLAAGFGERVIFRELFLKGLTLLDLAQLEAQGGLTMSHVAARQEVRTLIEAINLPPAGYRRAAAQSATLRQTG